MLLWLTVGRLEAEVKQILDGLERDPVRIKQYFNHARIGLAEELSEQKSFTVCNNCLRS